MKYGLIVAILICIGFGFALVSVKKKSSQDQLEASDRISTLSNQWVATSAKLDEQKQVAMMLEKDLEKQKQQYGDLTNIYSQTAANLARTESSLKATQKEVELRDARIAELESANHELDQRALTLNTAITNLTAQIEDTKKRLAASEGDKVFLEEELKRLMAEKAELERQFNDLVVLRAQVAKLKEELSIARRLEWIRQGLFAAGEQKGAQKLIQGLTPPTPKPRPNYDLNVEISADGSVKVIPPLTNTPPVAVPPPGQ